MRRILSAAFGLVVALGVVAALAAGVATAQAADAEPNASLGADVSAFMQASEADAENGVDDGMFDAALNRTNDPDAKRALVERRQRRLAERDRSLRTRRERIGETPGIRARAVATRVAVGAAGLERSANDTRAVAASVGADTDRLEAIRSSAREMRGPDVAALASGLAGPPGNARGSPEAAPGNRTGANRPGRNGSAAPRGPPGNGTDGADRSDAPQRPTDGDSSGAPAENGRAGPPDRSDPGPDADPTDEPENAENSGGSDADSAGANKTDRGSNGGSDDSGPPASAGAPN
ncbi:hypothetical protein [Natronomonas sp.]|uniref:hypothetical protein n=1 Tax=Natronomonas sp. TaxID=2184060 RepID=UPI0026360FD5|nr:hypothetical protein [Natronomonas sp.]